MCRECPLLDTFHFQLQSGRLLFMSINKRHYIACVYDRSRTLCAGRVRRERWVYGCRQCKNAIKAGTGLPYKKEEFQGNLFSQWYIKAPPKQTNAKWLVESQGRSLFLRWLMGFVTAHLRFSTMKWKLLLFQKTSCNAVTQRSEKLRDTEEVCVKYCWEFWQYFVVFKNEH